MNNSQKKTLGGLLIILTILWFGTTTILNYIIEGGQKVNRINLLQGNYNSGTIRYIGNNFTMQNPDYTKTGYHKVYFINQSKFIYLECVNSTMKIIDNKLECVK